LSIIETLLIISQVRARVLVDVEDSAGALVIVEVVLDTAEESLVGMGLTEGGEAVCHLIEVNHTQ